MTLSITVDHGNSRTKVATYDEAAGKPILVELGREIRAVIPSIIYVPNEGSVLIGDDAQYEAARDPGGIVRHLKRDLLKPGTVRQDRDIERPELAAILFRYLRENCQRLLCDGKTITKGCFTVPLSFTLEQRDAIKSAAHNSGFNNVILIDEPVAAARFYQRQIALNSPAMVVCDVGAVATDLTLLDCSSDQPRLFPGLSRGGLREGAEEIDGAIWDALKRDLPDDFSTAYAPTLRLQLRQIKESFARLKRAEEKLDLGQTTLTVPHSLVESCLRRFLEKLQDEMGGFTKAMKKVGVKEAALVLAGGGSNLPGLVAALEKSGWSGSVHLHRDSEFATVLGAVEVPRTTLDSSSTCTPSQDINRNHPSESAAHDRSPATIVENKVTESLVVHERKRDSLTHASVMRQVKFLADKLGFSAGSETLAARILETLTKWACDPNHGKWGYVDSPPLDRPTAIAALERVCFSTTKLVERASRSLPAGPIIEISKVIFHATKLDATRIEYSLEVIHGGRGLAFSDRIPLGSISYGDAPGIIRKSLLRNAGSFTLDLFSATS